MVDLLSLSVGSEIRAQSITEPTPLALEGQVLLTAGPPGNSRMTFLLVTTLPLKLCVFLAVFVSLQMVSGLRATTLASVVVI